MKHVLLIIGGLLLVFVVWKGMQEKEEKKELEEQKLITLRREEQEAIVKVLSWYVKVDSSRVVEHMVRRKMMFDLLSEDGEEFDSAYDYRAMIRTDSVVKVGIELAKQNKPLELLELLEEEKGYFYSHLDNTIDAELHFHGLFMILYNRCYEDKKVVLEKIIPLLEYTRIHVVALEVFAEKQHPYHQGLLKDLVRAYISIKKYEKATDLEEILCKRLDKKSEDYVFSLVLLGKLYGCMGMKIKQDSCVRVVKDSPLFEELNAMPLSDFQKRKGLY